MKNAPATNIYQLLDNELERLHEHVTHHYRTQDHRRMDRGPGFNQWSSREDTMDRLALASHSRIMEIQTMLMEAIKNTDAVIQNRIAELALTGDSSEKSTK